MSVVKMPNTPSTTRQAFASFQRGDYAHARSCYQNLAAHIGEAFFKANIEICTKRLSAEYAAGGFGTPQFINTHSLKAYSTQYKLDMGSTIKAKLDEKPLNDVAIKSAKSHEIQQEVKPNAEYTLSIKCTVKSGANPKGALADVSFYDEAGRMIPKPYSGMAASKAFGAYFYIQTQAAEGAEPIHYSFYTPQAAARARIKIVAFGAKNGMVLSGDYRLDLKTDALARSLENPKYIEAFNQILLEAEDIPDSNGSEYFAKHDFKVGVIGDVYMYNYYKDVFSSVHYLSPDNYQEILKKNLDIVIYTTCWKGINNEEWRGLKFRAKPKDALENILLHAKANNIKTVFQTIEDPSNFEYFLPIAEKFDYVLTTDTDCIERYKRELGHDRVYFGEYGVNPQLNNPIGCRRNIRNAAFFAGSYPKRYKERCEDMEIVFDSIVDSGGQLLVADRNFGANAEDLIYPPRFQSSILPPVQHSTLQKLHKLFRFNLNFNSIKQSPTMCAMRVYELQAQGNGLISNYASSVYNKFPGIRILPNKQDMSLDFGRNETWEEYKSNIANVREVLNSKSSYTIVSTLLNNIGLSSPDKSDITIAVLCAQKSDSVIRSFEAQAHPHKVLIEESNLANWPQFKAQHKIGYFCWFDEENVYERHYLSDLLNAFKFTDSIYTTKNSHFDKFGTQHAGKEHEYTNLCSGKGLSLFSAKYLNPEDTSEPKLTQSFALEKGYSIDPFELNFTRHIQQRNTSEGNYQLSVIVPVYNNARFLTTKCIPSLQRNLLWPAMEVLLVDDGSTDKETLITLQHLESLYPNVRVRFNYDGGSGSASRPRNQGIDMATAPLITFLDPDNEISSGGYDLLMESYKEASELANEQVDFVSGFHVKVAEDVREIGKHTSKKISIITDFKKGYFERGRFPVIATQSAVLSKKFLNQNNIRFVEKSAGQDTLFGWEIIAKSKCGAFNNQAHIIYYADRTDSITNQVDVSYFKKKVILEESQVKFLKDNGFLDIYLDAHFDNFMNNWYIKKLERVNPSDYKESIDCLRYISKLYGKNLEDFLHVPETEGQKIALAN
ncbi:glycosyltransferase [Pseudomonas monteilii]|uniref:glycosyltransferase n=1 Tax=Pseudomonas monteilii TaxID=76759 RepID=UPI003CFF65AE